MDIYVGIIEDRHTDVNVEVFTSSDVAIAWARKLAQSFGPVDEPELNKSMVADGWVYYGVYSCEGDSIRVVRRTLDNPDEIK